MVFGRPFPTLFFVVLRFLIGREVLRRLIGRDVLVRLLTRPSLALACSSAIAVGVTSCTLGCLDA